MGNGRTEVKFATSVYMSTYLLCFIVSDLVSLSKKARGVVDGAKDFELRVFSTEANLSKVKFALDTAVGVIEYFAEYFDIAYPLPKLGK